MSTFKQPEIVFLNGKIITLDDSDTIANAVAVANGRIISVGSHEEIKQSCDADVRVVDLEGKTVLPGLIDPHTHLANATLIFHTYLDGRCPPNRSVADILEKIRDRVRKAPKGEWIPVQGSFFAAYKLAEKRLPTRAELDAVAPNHPVVYVNTVHSAVLNTCALEMAHITKESPDPHGGMLEKDSKTGELTGFIKEWHGLLPILSFSHEQIKAAIRDLTPNYWIKQGCTSAYSYADGREMRVYQDLARESALPLRIQAMPMDIPLGPDRVIESMAILGLEPGVGDKWLKVGGVKIFIDGAYMGLSAATHEPYINLPDENYYGIIKFNSQKQLNELVLKGHNAGLQLHIHAIGEKAQDWALDALENALQKNPRYHRHRIEHLGNLMTSPERIRRAKELDIIPVTTIEWLYEEGDFIETHLGRKRRDQSWPLRSMLDAGLKVANCSDTVGATPFSTNPFYSMWCAVNRRTFLGDHLLSEQAISIKEAIRLYTRNAAYSGFEETLKGSIEPGKYADMIVINKDIFTIPDYEIKDIKVEMTILDGKIVYQRQ